MADELTEDDVVTIRKALIEDIISDLRKALIKRGNIYSELERFQNNIEAAITRLHEILNEAVS